jgi:hypothetical protein
METKQSPPPLNNNHDNGSGAGSVLMGFIMMIAGGYLFLDAIQVSHHFSMSMSLFRVGSMQMTPGLVLVPFIFGIGMIFYNPKNDIGWLLVVASIVMLTFGIISNLHFRLRTMSTFELMMMLGLAVGGIGLFMRGAFKLRK